MGNKSSSSLLHSSAASKLSEEDLLCVNQRYLNIDPQRVGIKREAFIRFMQHQLHLPRAYLADRIFTMVDADKGFDFIGFEQFCSLAYLFLHSPPEAHYRLVFCLYDHESKGYITADQIRDFCFSYVNAAAKRSEEKWGREEGRRRQGQGQGEMQGQGQGSSAPEAIQRQPMPPPPSAGTATAATTAAAAAGPPPPPPPSSTATTTTATANQRQKKLTQPPQAPSPSPLPLPLYQFEGLAGNMAAMVVYQFDRRGDNRLNLNEFVAFCKAEENAALFVKDLGAIFVGNYTQNSNRANRSSNIGNNSSGGSSSSGIVNSGQRQEYTQHQHQQQVPLQPHY